MASGASQLIQLRRKENSHPWGFIMQGGLNGVPLFFAKVNPKGIAGKAGLQVGDAILQICGTSVMGFSHQDAKNEMMRAGNEMDLTVQRGAVNPKDPALLAALGLDQGEPRSELDEGSINPGMNQGTKYRNVMPKTYKILEQQLASDEPPPSAMSHPPQQMAPVHAKPAPQAQAKPSSIFDRNKQDRSGYLVAQGNTIQKTFGEQ